MADPLELKYNKIMLMMFNSVEGPLMESQMIMDRINLRLDIPDTGLGPIKQASSDKGRAFFKTLAELKRIGDELKLLEETLLDPETLKKAGAKGGYQTLRAENELDLLLDSITADKSKESAVPSGPPTKFLGNRVLKPHEAPATLVDYSKPVPDTPSPFTFTSFEEPDTTRKMEKGDSSFNITLAPLESLNPTAHIPDMPPELVREQQLIAQGKFKPTPVAPPEEPEPAAPAENVNDDPSDPAPPKPKPLSFAGMPMNPEQEAEFKEYQIAKYEYETWENRQILKRKKAGS